MGMGVNQAYCGDHFTIYKNTESFCCTFETNILLHVSLYFNFLKYAYSIQ